MREQYLMQLKKLHEAMLEMGELCQQAIGLAIRALGECNDALIAQEQETDSEIDKLEREIEASLPSELVLDVSGITFMDSAGIAVALRGWQRMRELGGCVELRHVAPQPKKVLEAAGLGRMMAIR